MLHDMCTPLAFRDHKPFFFVNSDQYVTKLNQKKLACDGGIKKHFKNQSYAPAQESIFATLGVCSPWRLQRKVPSSILGRRRDHEQVEFGFVRLDGPKGLVGGVIHHISLATSPHGTAI